MGRLRIVSSVVLACSLIAVALSVTAVEAAAAAPQFVQVRAATPQGSVASVAVAYQNAQTATDLNVVIIGWRDATATITNVADTAGNNYQVAAPLTRGTNLSQAIYYAANINAAGAGTNTVTVTFDSPAAFPDLRILEYRGADTVSPFDVTASGTGTSTAAATPQATIHAAPELVVGGGTAATGFSSVGTSYYLRTLTSPDANIAEDKPVANIGGYKATANLATSQPWVMQMATFTPAGTTTTTTTTTSATTTTTTTGTTTTTIPTTTTTLSGDPRATVGSWAAPVASGGTVMQHAVLVPGSSKILFFEDGAGAKLLDMTTGAITSQPAATNLFCAGQTVLADGRVLVLGGDAAATSSGNPNYGTVATNIYNPANNTWIPAAAMHATRWYPTGTKLPDGRIMATDGTKGGVTQPTPEIYNPANNTWTLMSTSANLNIRTYPYLFVTPDGRVVEVGTFGGTQNIKALNLGSQTWSTVDATVTDAGSAAMYRPGRILRTGTQGGPGTTAQVATAAATTIDMTSGAPKLVQTASMANARAFLNLTNLPDGNVLVTGGKNNHDITSAAGAVYAAEEWSPSTGKWTTLASEQIPRFYHSVAVLLPDGRVLVGGGWGGAGGQGTRQRTYEIYSPPYLFKGARPAITSAPGSTGYGSSFAVATPDGASISSVVLTAPAAVTHNFDENNREVPLAFSVTANGLQVTAPPNANYAPPGPYLLWIVNSDGVPSVAQWITIG